MHPKRLLDYINSMVYEDPKAFEEVACDP